MLIPIRHLDDGPAAVLLVGPRRRELLVDPADYPRLARYSLTVKDGYPMRCFPRRGRWHAEPVARFLLAPPAGVHVRYRSANVFDCRRANLVAKCGSVHYVADHPARPWQARVRVDRRLYNLGYWPSEAWAREVCALVAPVAAELRGRGLTHPAIRKALRRAAGLEVEP